MADFHFMRPLWLLLLLAIPALFAMRHRLRNGSSGWARYIPAHLLQPLMRGRDESTSGLARSPLIPLYLALACLSIALAGPSWRQAPTPLKQPQDSLVILLDLSLSMLATDVEPDRLTQAKRKVRDILDQRQGGLTALVVYSGDAHTVTPLTGDTRTIEAMLSVLEPTIMPAQGNRADLAVSQAINLLQQGAPGQGRMVLISDAVPEQQRSGIQQQLAETSYPLNTLVVGTREGGPIPLAKRGFIRDQGKIVISRARPDRLADLARDSGGKSHELTLDNRDIQALALQPSDSDDWQTAEDDLATNRWQDDGYWLLWAVLPLLLAGWRRGAFAAVVVLLIPLAGAPRPAQAMEWESLWQREDQRGPGLIQHDPGKAAEILEQPGWRGSALYRDGQFAEAAEVYADQPGAIGHYNRGNALAHAGKLEDAIEAYQQALNEDPSFEDASFNQKLVQELLNQQQESQNQSGDGQSQPDNEQDSEQPSPSENPGEESQEGSGQASKNESQSQSSGDQQESSQQEQESQDNPGDPSSENSDQETSASQGQSEPAAPDSQAGQAQAPAEISEQPLSQGQEQWLRRIPDNPGGLLQRKFLQQHQQRQTTPDEGDTPW
ncbi:VWA domain-containing protein [Marinobacter daepoensis]|uniref:VWA domain-containing protein n=1 Tax=Marinobacter daepoensis TaxID=262077 RepID=A0ABS3BFT8_9GAMM|nr:VWA domain-containing protein [Marinobacter daepoensis]MBN7769572.1 VWA domain-containing protein [Marinobacter daepoensis]MBY6078262.1 VWA domain-containing protein [Marinobacter daepoensis]